MTVIEHLFADLHKSLREIVAMHPEIQTSFQPGWTKELQDQKPAEAFDAKPKKRRRKA